MKPVDGHQVVLVFLPLHAPCWHRRRSAKRPLRFPPQRPVRANALDASTGALIPVAGAVACVASARREASPTQATLACAAELVVAAARAGGDGARRSPSWAGSERCSIASRTLARCAARSVALTATTTATATATPVAASGSGAAAIRRESARNSRNPTVEHRAQHQAAARGTAAAAGAAVRRYIAAPDTRGQAAARAVHEPGAARCEAARPRAAPAERRAGGQAAPEPKPKPKPKPKPNPDPNPNPDPTPTPTPTQLKLWAVRGSECVCTIDAHEDKVWARVRARVPGGVS